MTQHILDIESLPQNAPEEILARAQQFAVALDAGKLVEPSLKGKVIFSLFFEDSTRTRMSFELAAKRLGAEVVNFSIGTSSLKKNESYFDTLATLAAMRPDAVIIRHSEYNAPRFAAQIFKCPVINAGDSWRAHPTQALLDALTILEAKGKITGQTIAICGDVAHSRVARSNYMLLTRLGAHVRIVAPALLMPPENEFEKATRFSGLDEGIKGADIIMMLRLQKERMPEGLVESDAAFHAQYGLSYDKLKHAKPDVYIMHPGPINRGVELDDAVADDPDRSLILRQVSLGVPVRMAALEWCLLS